MSLPYTPIHDARILVLAHEVQTGPVRVLLDTLRGTGYADVNAVTVEDAGLPLTVLLETHARTALNAPPFTLILVEPPPCTDAEEFAMAGERFPGALAALVDGREQEAEACAAGADESLPLHPWNEELVLLRVEKVLLDRTCMRRLQKSQRRSQKLFANILAVMGNVLESKDPYTLNHSNAVARYSRAIGRRAGLSRQELNRLGLAALFHDLGKLGVPEAILNKPSDLTDEEFEIIKAHPSLAAKILRPLTELGDIVAGVEFHHERMDGSGYPRGLGGEDIPIYGRIIALADAYDTMISERTYRNPLPPEKVRFEIKENAGTQFDSDLADVLLEIIDETISRDGTLSSISPMPAPSL